MSVLESALSKISKLLKSNELRVECINRLAAEIADPSDGYTDFRTWYEDALAGYKDEITFNETVNLMKYCSLHFPRTTLSRPEMTSHLHKNLSFTIPANKEDWLSTVPLMKIESDKPHVAIIPKPHGSSSEKVKTRWSSLKKYVKTGKHTQPIYPLQSFPMLTIRSPFTHP